jgi:hypothetical protein
MSAVYVNNLVINTGTDFDKVFTLANSQGNAPLNLTGYTAESKMAKHAGAAVKTTFNVAIDAPTTGIVAIGLTSGATASLKEGRYVYDVVLDDGTKKTRVIEGMVLVRRGVTD